MDLVELEEKTITFGSLNVRSVEMEMLNHQPESTCYHTAIPVTSRREVTIVHPEFPIFHIPHPHFPLCPWYMYIYIYICIYIYTCICICI